MVGVFPCSPCSFGAFELAVIGNGYDFVLHRLWSHYRNLSCSPCSFGAFELAIIGKGYILCSTGYGLAIKM